MTPRSNAPSPAVAATVAVLVFGGTLALRTWGISTRFWLLGDQIRDWGIALGPFRALPFTGPATHVGGYTIGPAFYWILWSIRVVFGPWFQNLPHAGGIGQAALQSAADVLLLLAIWRRTGSMWAALATVLLVATAGYDLCLSALVWNPVVGSTLAKMATALVLLDWHRRSMLHAALLAAIAWAAVHAYTGAIYVAVSVFAAMVIEPLVRHDSAGARRNAIVLTLVVVLLQVPYAAHQFASRFSDQAMGAVTGSVARIVTGQAAPEFSKSREGYLAAVGFIEVSPWQVSTTVLGWVLLAASVVVMLRHWRDPALLIMTVLPPVAAILGYALFLAPLDHYYYLSLMPAAVLTCVLAATAFPVPVVSRGMAIALSVGALAIVPSRYQFSTTLHRMPEYGALVRASREMAKRGLPMRAIHTTFKLPPTTDPEFMYRILGGKIDPASPWVADVGTTGDVTYSRMGGA